MLRRPRRSSVPSDDAPDRSDGHTRDRRATATRATNPHIDLAQSKTANDQHWEITPSVQAILDEVARLPGRQGAIDGRLANPSRYHVHQSWFQSLRQRALAAAGLKDLQFRGVRKAAVNQAKRLAAMHRSCRSLGSTDDGEALPQRTGGREADPSGVKTQTATESDFSPKQAYFFDTDVALTPRNCGNSSS